MIKFEIEALDHNDLFAELRAILGGQKVEPVAWPVAADAGRASGVAEQTVTAPAVRTRRSTKGAASEPEVVEAKISDAIANATPVAEREVATVTTAMVRESLIDLLQIGDAIPEEVLAQFNVKKVKDLTEEQFAPVHAAALARIKVWRDAK